MPNEIEVITHELPLNALVVFGEGGITKVIESIEAGVRAEPWDVSTPEGRKAMKSFAFKIARSKTALDDAGKTLVDDIKKQSGAIDKDRKLARDRLDALKAEFLRPLTEIEEAEDREQERLIAALATITIDETRAATMSEVDVDAYADRMRDIWHDTDWKHFKQRASDTLKASLDIAARLSKAAREREEEARIIAEALANERAEQKRLADIAQKEREEKIAAEATARAEQAAKAQEERAAAQHAAALAQVEADKQREANRHAEQLAQAEQNRKEAVAAEVARQQREQEAATLEAERLENDKKHRAKIHNEILLDLINLCGLTESQGKLVITKAAQRGLRNVRIIY